MRLGFLYLVILFPCLIDGFVVGNNLDFACNRIPVQHSPLLVAGMVNASHDAVRKGNLHFGFARQLGYLAEEFVLGRVTLGTFRKQGSVSTAVAESTGSLDLRDLGGFGGFGNQGWRGLRLNGLLCGNNAILVGFEKLKMIGN